MTSPPSPPNRRRRRLLVTIAVLMLGLAWWFWPRVDQRFVGTWRDNWARNFAFQDDGTVTILDSQGEHASLRWHVEGAQLLFGEKPYWIVPASARGAWRKLMGNQAWEPQIGWSIVDITQDVIVLKVYAEPTILTRVK